MIVRKTPRQVIHKFYPPKESVNINNKIKV